MLGCFGFRVEGVELIGLGRLEEPLYAASKRFYWV